MQKTMKKSKKIGATSVVIISYVCLAMSAGQSAAWAKPEANQAGIRADVKAQAKVLTEAQRAKKRIARVIKELGDEDFYVREEAMYALMQSEAIKSSQMVQAYGVSDDFEVRSRIKRVLWHYLVRDEIRLVSDTLVKRDYGMLGITFAGKNDILTKGSKYENQGIQLKSTTLGLPAYAFLRPGDRILVFDGAQIKGDYASRIELLASKVRGRKPGDKIVMKVYRGKRVISVTFAYGSALGWDKIYGGNGDVLHKSVVRRLKRRLADALSFDVAKEAYQLHAGG